MRFFAARSVLPLPRPLRLARLLTLAALLPLGVAAAQHSSLTAQAPQAEFSAPPSATAGFTVKFKARLGPVATATTLLEIPGVLRVELRSHDPRDRARQNYPAFKMPDGSVPVLEAHLALYSREHPDWRNMTIGFPIAMLAQPEGEHDVELTFSGVRWAVFVDGQLLDSDWPFGYPPWAGQNSWRLDPIRVRGAALYVPALPDTRPQVAARLARPIQYWTPPGHNAWVGDVATLYHRGRYHVFYLYDRRHHLSKFGKGGHRFEHLSTTDFKTWIEHESPTPLEEQWESIGTGTPFLFDGKFYLSYGLHTERFYPDDQTTLPEQQRQLQTNGATATFTRNAPGMPVGSTFAVSEDGIAPFRKSWEFFHPARNPSVFTAPDGSLRMIASYGAKGIWQSDRPSGGWRSVSPDFPPGGDCTFFFRWGRFDYIIGGFKNLWSKPADAPDSAYHDVVAEGLDFYDGSNVPAISGIANGRYLMAAWIPVRGWGGNLVIRELVQQTDGRIGSKWMEELTLPTAKPTKLPDLTNATSVPTPGKSFLLTLDVEPAAVRQGSLRLEFRGTEGEGIPCELQLALDEHRAQFAPAVAGGFARRQKTLREGGKPHDALDYAIEQLQGTDQPFTLRVLVKSDAKQGGSIIDAEIAGQRTMISYRADLTVRGITFRPEGVAVKNVRIARLGE